MWSDAATLRFWSSGGIVAFFLHLVEAQEAGSGSGCLLVRNFIQEILGLQGTRVPGVYLPACWT